MAKKEERFQCWQIALSELGSALEFFRNDITKKERWQHEEVSVLKRVPGLMLTGTFDTSANECVA